jgi:hypothetical protein
MFKIMHVFSSDSGSKYLIHCTFISNTNLTERLEERERERKREKERKRERERKREKERERERPVNKHVYQLLVPIGDGNVERRVVKPITTTYFRARKETPPRHRHVTSLAV